MHLRHIRPRSVDWYDATFDDGDRQFQLSPEQKVKLRHMGEAEPLELAPVIHGAPVQPLGAGRSLL